MLMMVTGGSGSGKSEFAESLVTGLADGPNLYIATMFPFDEECHKRIARHREMRKDKGFDTLECYTDLSRASVPKGTTVLLECMSNLVANEMFQENGAHENTVKAVVDGVEFLQKQTENLVIVTNEIFSEAAEYQGDTKLYQEYLGMINQKLSDMADEVVEVVYGIPVYQKKYKASDVDRRSEIR